MTETSAQSLRVLVTRPAHQTQNLNRLLTADGCQVLSFPTIAIEASPTTAFLQQLRQNIRHYDIALFVSRNAVDYAFRHLQSDALPDSLQMGVIGKGSWQALQEQGIHSQIIPVENYNSEGLLAAQQLQQVVGKRIIIFRGQEGRNLLGDTLGKRGARVDYCEVYRRVLPNYQSGHFDRLVQHGFPQLAVFTSSEGLSNGFKLLNLQQCEKLRHIDWLLISERMRETARQLRHNADIVIARRASDEGILQAIQAWRQQQGLSITHETT
jgi:uroporphyrinogen-III synthase